MLKLLIQIHCDGCGQNFPFARLSDYSTDSLSFNTNVLSAMLPDCFWWLVKNNDERSHLCQECWNDCNVPDDLPASIYHEDSEEIPF